MAASPSNEQRKPGSNQSLENGLVVIGIRIWIEILIVIWIGLRLRFEFEYGLEQGLKLILGFGFE